MFVDSHAHLNDDKLLAKAAEIVAASNSAGVGRIVNAGYDLPTSEAGLRLAEDFAEVYFTVGMHPHDSKLATTGMYQRFEELCAHPKAVAYGEIGLDYHYDLSPREVQKKVFAEQLALAHSLGLPVVLHLREAYEDMNKVLEQNSHYLLNGVLIHCYSGSAELVKYYTAHFDSYFSFGGAITFAKNKDEVLKAVPKDRLLLETDCPYMTPIPYRGKLNTPANIPLIAAKMAEILNMGIAEIESLTTVNAYRFYGRMK